VVAGGRELDALLDGLFTAPASARSLVPPAARSTR
jgi:hypothetical protein